MTEPKDKTERAIKAIQQAYLRHPQPWVVGFSGGKDSTCTLQLVWKAIAGLPKEERTKHVYVISSDTMVETPVITNLIHNTMKRIGDAAVEQGLPITARVVKPAIENSFWVNLIGRGYPAPQQKFRWCTDRLKIEPANKFILEIVSKHGESIVVLGARSDESASRAQVLSKQKDQYDVGATLPRHSTLPNSYVYTPIMDWTTAEVWEYLLKESRTPWGTSNRDLAAIYKDSTAGECPLVVDKTTPSCGNSRFGCWTCTVVERNHSLENMVDNGEDWMAPLVRYWNILKETNDPARKREFRSFKRRTGQVTFMSNDAIGDAVKVIPGPYKFEFRKTLLSELLKTQIEINTGREERLELIADDELRAIRKLWLDEENDWEDSVPKLYAAIVGKTMEYDADDSAAFGVEELEILGEACLEHGVPKELVARLLDKEREFTVLSRRSSLQKELGSILHEEWRDEADVVNAEINRKKNAERTQALTK